MPSELENSIRSAAEKVAQYIADASNLEVTTSYVQIGANAIAVDFSQAQPAASTLIKLDGDCKSIIPMRTSNDGTFEIDRSLFEIHERNVASAIDYRSRILNSVLGILSPPTTRR